MALSPRYCRNPSYSYKFEINSQQDFSSHLRKEANSITSNVVFIYDGQRGTFIQTMYAKVLPINLSTVLFLDYFIL